MFRTARPTLSLILLALFALSAACGDTDGEADTGRVRGPSDAGGDARGRDAGEDAFADDVTLDDAGDAALDDGGDASLDDGGDASLDDGGDASLDDADDAALDDAEGLGDTSGEIEPEVIVMPGAETLPEMFESATLGAAEGPAVLYPADNTLMPRNVIPPVIQWDGAEDGRYRVKAETDTRVHYVYTRDWRWQAESGLWLRWVSETRDGSLRISVASVSRGGELTEGEPVRVMFSSSAVGGAVYYWAPGAGGIVRLAVDEPAPEPFLTPGMLPCVGCHGLSPDGSRLAYTLASAVPQTGTLGVIGTDDAQTEYISPSAGLPIFYPSFGPDNVHLAGTRGEDVVILNTDTAQVTATLQTPGDTVATYPTWSPRDDMIVFSAGTQDGGLGLGASNAGLARVRRGPDGEWGPATWLVENGDAGGAPENLFYPAFSPDSRWLVFNRATSMVAVGGSPAGSSIWMVPSYGGEAVRLDHANGPMGTTNSWPKWAPSSSDGTLWVAFTSDRLYGRLGGGSTERGQIWIAGMKPGAVAEGEDPSFSAYWMPGQDVEGSNHVAYWAAYVKE